MMAAKEDAAEAYVSLATNNHYCHGAIALGQSLRHSNTTRKLCLLITKQVTIDMREHLQKIWDEILVIEEMSSFDVETLKLIQRPELAVTFTKLHAWRLIHYTKCVFLDADTLVLTNVDELFEREELSAAPDIGWPDIFNSGVFVYQPNLETFARLMELASTEGSFDGGDQGLLNVFWSDWSLSDSSRRLPFTYNVVYNIAYSYPPAFKKFRHNIKIIHFLGSAKPWHHTYVENEDNIIFYPGTNQSEYGAVEFIKKWWKVYKSAQAQHCIEQIESTTVATEALSLSPVSELTESERKASWERGQPDYFGTDQSENVMAHIQAQL